MRLFNYKITGNSYYPFGDVDYFDFESILQVNDDSLSSDEIKDKLIKILNLSTEYKEVIGHFYVVDIKLEPILII